MKKGTRKAFIIVGCLLLAVGLAFLSSAMTTKTEMIGYKYYSYSTNPEHAAPGWILTIAGGILLMIAWANPAKSEEKQAEKLNTNINNGTSKYGYGNNASTTTNYGYGNNTRSTLNYGYGNNTERTPNYGYCNNTKSVLKSTDNPVYGGNEGIVHMIICKIAKKCDTIPKQVTLKAGSLNKKKSGIYSLTIKICVKGQHMCFFATYNPQNHQIICNDMTVYANTLGSDYYKTDSFDIEKVNKMLQGE